MSSSSSTPLSNGPTGDDDLYNLLNVSRNASADDLKKSYRRLSQLFHPDKHVPEDAKREATLMFTRVKEAFEILSTDKLRKIYDEFGLEAARNAATPELELVPYQDLAERFRNDAQAGKSPGAGGESARDAYFTVSNSVEPRIDATGLVVALEEGSLSSKYLPEGLAVITQVGISSVATAYVTQSDTLTVRYGLAGHVGRRSRDAPVGDLMLAWRRQLDAYTHLEASTQSAVDDPYAASFNLKMFRALSKYSSLAWEVTCDPIMESLTSALSAARSFNDRCSASVSWAFGGRGGYAFTWSRSAYDEYTSDDTGRDEFGGVKDDVELRREDGFYRWFVQRVSRLTQPMGLRWTARMSTGNPSVAIVLRRPVGENAPLWLRCDPTGPGGPHVRVSGLLGMLGWEVKAGVGHRFVLSDTEIGSSLGVGTMGIIWRFKVRRGAHRLSVPIVLQSGFVDTETAIVASLATSLVTSAVQILVIQPWLDWQEGKERASAKAMRKSSMDYAREEAEQSIRLMTVQCERVRSAEESVLVDGVPGGGLLIERALYGVRKFVRKARLSDASVNGREIEEEMVEVTTALQVLVDKSAVQIVSATKSTLSGFWDASAFGDKDELGLRVWYKFRGMLHDCLVRDDEPIEIPLSSHRVSYWS